MNYKGRKLLLLFSLILWAACSPYNQLKDGAKLMIGSDKGIVRGITFDMPVDSVLAIETEELYVELEFYLGYEKAVDSTETIEIEYSFNKTNQLDFISIYYTLDDKETVYEYVESLTAYYTKKYGKAAVDELGWHTWRFEDKTGLPGTIEIVLNADITATEQGVDLEMVKYYTFK